MANLTKAWGRRVGTYADKLMRAWGTGVLVREDQVTGNGGNTLRETMGQAGNSRYLT